MQIVLPSWCSSSRVTWDSLPWDWYPQEAVAALGLHTLGSWVASVSLEGQPSSFCCVRACKVASVVSYSLWPIWTIQSPSSSSVHGILQAKILEWVAMPSSRGSSQPGDQTHVSWHDPTPKPGWHPWAGPTSVTQICHLLWGLWQNILEVHGSQSKDWGTKKDHLFKGC